jgi:hypothetical protein
VMPRLFPRNDGRFMVFLFRVLALDEFWHSWHLMEWVGVERGGLALLALCDDVHVQHCCIAPAFTMVDVDKETTWF